MQTIYTHEDCLDHQPGSHHPECASRQSVIIDALRGSPLAIEWHHAPLGTEEQVLMAHSKPHWQHVVESIPTQGLVSLDPDTHASSGTLRAALRGVGGACAAVDDLLADKASNAFCLTRPPGHHATRAQAMGFCFFNHAAIAALYAHTKGKQKRVAIVDFDVHHGNGTQDIFAGRPDLLYVSTHQFPHYPGTGSARENRPGNILNIPLASGTDDETYESYFSDIAMPALKAFEPNFISVSAGFDAHARDPLGGLGLSDEIYHWLGIQLGQLARQFASGRLLSVLEGGYNLSVLGGSVTTYLSGVETGLEG